MAGVTRTSRALALLACSLVVAALVGGAHAQGGTNTAPAEAATVDGSVVAGADAAANADAASAADAAVRAWLDRPATVLTDLLGLDAQAVCERLPDLLAAPPPPEGTRVNLDDRRELDAGDVDRRRFSYSAVRPPDQLDVVVVELARSDAGDAWEVVSVGFRTDPINRSWLGEPVAGAVFALLSLVVLALLVRPGSPLRRGIVTGLAYVREHRRLVLGTMIVLYAAFAAGFWSGAALPETCDDAVAAVLGQALGQVGATDALLSGDPLRLAVTIFYQNFGVVTLLLFWLGLLFGVPAYLMALPQFFANGVPFGALYVYTGPIGLLGTVLLIVIELTAYFLVVAGGGMLLVTIVRQGLGAFPLALRKTLAMLLIAGVLLLIGAWYEVGLILLA